LIIVNDRDIINIVLGNRGEIFMTLETDLEQIVGNIWYVKDRFDIISKHKFQLERALSFSSLVPITNVTREELEQKI